MIRAVLALVALAEPAPLVAFAALLRLPTAI